MRRVLLLFLLLGSTRLFAQTPPDTTDVSYILPLKYQIAAINITGDYSYLGRQSVLGLTGLYPGQTITIPGEEITLALTRLWRQNLFSDAKIYLDSTVDNQAYLTVYVMTRPKMSAYNFEGLTKAQAKKVKDELGLKSNDIITEQMLQNAIFRIQNYYSEKGFPNAEVEVTTAPDTLFKGNSRLVTFHVKPGSRLKIKEVNIVGNNEVADKKLRRSLKGTKEKKWWNPLRAGKYEEQKYEEDKDRLIAYYNTQGYKDATIIADSVVTNEDGVRVNIQVDEGQKYYFNKITFAGNTKYSNETLSRILNIKQGETYNPAKIEANLYASPDGSDVTSLYMNNGYLFFNANPVETSIKGDSVNVEVRIFEGPQATVGNVTVTGNTRTYDHVILREIRTRPGDKFSRADIIRSQRDLAALGYFDPQQMNVIPKPDPRTGTVDIEYQVVEKPNDQVELSGGWGGGQIVGVLGLSLNNFSARNIFRKNSWQGYPSGDGQRLAIRAQSNGKFYQSYNFSFTEPWLGGKRRNSLTISTFYSVWRGYAGGSSELKSPGASIGLGRALDWPDNYFVWFNSLSFQRYQFKEYQLLPTFPNYRDGVSNNFNLKSTLMRNSLDDQIFPTQGSTFSFSVQATVPYSVFRTIPDDMPPAERFRWLEYHKWKLDFTQFVTLGNSKFTLMGQAKFGFLGLYNKKLGLSPFERFYIGGDGLNNFFLDGREVIRLRGYKDPSALLNDGNYPNPAAIGGTMYNKFSFELRHPIVNTEMARIHGLVFVEGGANAASFKDYNPFRLSKSFGAGLRLFLPMFGMMGVDFGYGIDANGVHFEPHILIGQSLF